MTRLRNNSNDKKMAATINNKKSIKTFIILYF